MPSHDAIFCTQGTRFQHIPSSLHTYSSTGQTWALKLILRFCRNFCTSANKELLKTHWSCLGLTPEVDRTRSSLSKKQATCPPSPRSLQEGHVARGGTVPTSCCSLRCRISCHHRYRPTIPSMAHASYLSPLRPTQRARCSASWERGAWTTCRPRR